MHLHDEAEGIEAHGEGALPPYYPSTAEASLGWLNQLAQENDVGSWEARMFGSRAR